MTWDQDVKVHMEKTNRTEEKLRSMAKVARGQQSFINTKGVSPIDIDELQKNMNRLESLNFSVPYHVSDYSAIPPKDLHDVSVVHESVQLYSVAIT